MSYKAPTYHYPDKDPYAVDIAAKYGLDDAQFQILNFLCRGDFYLMNDGSAFFESVGLKSVAHKDWIKKKIKPLVEAGILSQKAERCGRNWTWYFWDPRYELMDLANGGCYSTGDAVFKIRDALGLPIRFWRSEFGPIQKNGYTTSCERKVDRQYGYDYVSFVLSVEYGQHKKECHFVACGEMVKYAEMMEVTSFLDMVNVVGHSDLRQIETTQDIEDYLRKLNGRGPTCTKHKNYNPKWLIYYDDLFEGYVVYMERVEGMNIYGTYDRDPNGDCYVWDASLYEVDLNRLGFTCQKPLVVSEKPKRW